MNEVIETKNGVETITYSEEEYEAILNDDSGSVKACGFTIGDAGTLLRKNDEVAFTEMYLMWTDQRENIKYKCTICDETHNWRSDAEECYIDCTTEEDEEVICCPNCKNEDLDHQRQAVIDVDQKGFPVLERDAVVFISKKIEVHCPECMTYFELDV